MTLYPRSLFGRLALLLLAVVAIALVTTIAVFRHDRAALLERAFSDTKIAQLQAVRADPTKLLNLFPPPSTNTPP